MYTIQGTTPQDQPKHHLSLHPASIYWEKTDKIQPCLLHFQETNNPTVMQASANKVQEDDIRIRHALEASHHLCYQTGRVHIDKDTHCRSRVESSDVTNHTIVVILRITPPNPNMNVRHHQADLPTTECTYHNQDHLASSINSRHRT